MDLTPTQSNVLAFIRASMSNGPPPTRHEIRLHFGWRSDNAAQDHLAALQHKGALTLIRGKARGIRLAPPMINVEETLKLALMKVASLSDESPIVEIANEALVKVGYRVNGS